MRTLGQKRAAFALEEVMASKCEKQKEFKTFCAGAPSVILQNGFGQALAFWYSKGKNKPGNKHKVLLDIIMKWLTFQKDDVQNAFIDPCKTTRDMIKSLSEMSQQQYLTAQGETLALLEWIKRYANAILEGD